MSGPELAAALERHGFGFFTGVPCSLLEDLIVALERRRRAPWVPAVREDIAVGLAGGAWLGGRHAAVLMQNSGLGTSANALASLSLLYGLPALLVVTWRGFEGKDAPEHLLTGAITPSLLELHGIPYRVLGPEGADDLLAWARREMDTREAPVALLVPPGAVGAGAASTVRTEGGPRERREAPDVVSEREAALVPAMSRREALAVALEQLGDEPVIHANGYIGRESCALADRPQSFYMIGSMGLAGALGLGLALVRPGRPSVVFDGDGNLLMSLGLVAMAASLRPERFVHVVFDNEAYGSTGGQRSPSREVRLDRIARAAGYRAAAVAAPDALAAALREALVEPGPHFVLAKVGAEAADAPRVPHAPKRIRDRFRASLGAA